MMAVRTHQHGKSLHGLLAGIAPVAPAQDCSVSGISMDSREVEPGDLFMAVDGDRMRGRDFIPEALARGAAAIAVEGPGTPAIGEPGVPILHIDDLRHHAGRVAARFFDNPSAAMDVIGVTGTNGKTSVTHYLAQCLSGLDAVPAGLIGTLGYGRYGHLRSGLHTTPDPVRLQRELASLRDSGARRVTMEVSSHALQQGRVAGVEFSVAVFTNLSQDHLDYHGEMAAYGAAKALLFTSGCARRAVINSDDAFGRELCTAFRGELLSYGLEGTQSGPGASVSGRLRAAAPGRLELDVRSPWGTGTLVLSLTGRFNASNALATLAVLGALGVPFERVLEALSQVTPVPGRMERFEAAGGPVAIVDYAHTPDALRQSLEALREACAGTLYCVFGCGGDRDRGKRPQMGRAAQALADRVIVTSDNPRTEDPVRIIEDILAGMPSRDHVVVEPDRARAIESALQGAGAGDVVLIAGKGHETWQEIRGTRHAFSDREIVARLLEQRA